VLRINDYDNFDALCQALSSRWLKVITDTPTNQPCTFALAGGTTPEPLYRLFDALLAKTNLPPIQLLATDERWVPDSDLQSNEGLLKRCFTQSASRCQLLSLKNNQLSPAEASGEINTRLQENCPHPFSSVILGMGVDGHIASLFSDTPSLLTNDETIHCVATLHPQTKHARISLSFSRLLNTRSIWIVIAGEEKRAVLKHALRENTSVSPISALLAAASCDVEVFWCP
jgi:6-phosphogluconolactonase